jgi:Cu(I)/Ag(I) efflux system membrane protein CusA/SilA
MLLCLDLGHDDWKKNGRLKTANDLRDAIYHGEVTRLRPKLMTAAVVIAGLLLVLWSQATHVDVMNRIATPMVGGGASPLLNLLDCLAIYFPCRSRSLAAPGNLIEYTR